MAALAPHLGPEQIGEALKIVNTIADGGHRFRGLSALLPYLSREKLREVVVAAKTISNEDDRARALAVLAPRLPNEQLDEALEAAEEIRDWVYRSMALTALSHRLVSQGQARRTSPLANRVFPRWVLISGRGGGWTAFRSAYDRQSDPR